MGSPKVSVIMPVFNAETTLAEAVDSVLSQSLEDLELVCVDDGSIDGSLAILREYEAKDSRVRVLTQRNAGAGTARNLGMEHAGGTYLAFLDADDRYESGMLEAMFSRCEGDGADLCVCTVQVYRQDTGEYEYPRPYLVMADLPDGRPFSRHDIPDTILTFATCALWNKMFSRRFVEERGLRFQGTRNANDVYFGYMALALAERVTVCPEALVTYRKGHGGHLQTLKDRDPFDFYRALLALRDGLKGAGAFDEVERSFANRVLADVEYNLGTLGTAEGYLELYSFLRDEGLDELGVFAHGREYYFDRDRYDRVLAIEENAPVIQIFGNAKGYLDDIWRLAGGTPSEVCGASGLPEVGGVKVSVIVTVYNMERYVAECIGSVTSQTFGDFEIVCVDDGSTDGSPNILAGLAATDARIRVIRQGNGGLSAARNAGLEAARGEYVLFLDSDDLLEPEALQTLYTCAKACDLDELFYTAEVFYESDEDGRVPDFHPDYAYRNVYPGPFSGRDAFIRLVRNRDLKDSTCLQLFRRGFLEEEGIAFREGIVHEDALFTMECLALAERVRIIDAPLYRRRVRPGSIMTGAGAFESAYGYFICTQDMLEFARTRGLFEDREYCEALAVRLRRLCDSAAKGLATLEEGDVLARMALLTDDEYRGFNFLVYDRARSVSLKLEHDRLYRGLAARIDIKDAGAPGNDVEVLELSDPGAAEEAPGWFRDGDGAGHVVRSCAGSLRMRLRCRGAGELQIKLKGQDVKDADGNSVPAWIDYTSLVVDGGPAFRGARAVWHNKPFTYRRGVEDGQVVEVSLTWHSHDEAALESERAVRTSAAWKAGRIITWLPRKVRGWVLGLKGRG